MSAGTLPFSSLEINLRDYDKDWWWTICRAGRIYPIEGSRGPLSFLVCSFSEALVSYTNARTHPKKPGSCCCARCVCVQDGRRIFHLFSAHSFNSKIYTFLTQIPYIIINFRKKLNCWNHLSRVQCQFRGTLLGKQSRPRPVSSYPAQARFSVATSIYRGIV